MRFTTVIISFVLYGFVCSAAMQCVKGLCLLEKQKNEFRDTALSVRFVSKSFKNACSGYGFESLSEWQKSCRALWKLEYISYTENKENLCGVWIRNSRRYEVFFKKDDCE